MGNHPKQLNAFFTKPFGTHTFYQGGLPDSPNYFKNRFPMKLKFCRVLETSFNVLEMLKLFTWCLFGYHSNS